MPSYIEKLPGLSQTMHEVALLIFPQFQLLDVSGPAEVFAAVNELRQEEGYRVRLYSADGGLVRSSTGLQMASEALPEPASLAGATLLVAGGFGVQQAMAAGRLARWLAQAAPYLARCGSVCTGAFLLAQAGLLDDRQAVTHWRYVALLRRLFPRVRVLDDALYVEDRGVYSSAGVSAGIDLCLSLVEAEHGRETSLRVAKGLVVHLQRQFSAELLAQQAAPGGQVERLVRWLREHLSEAPDVSAMAQAIAMSPRTLHRQCKAELGTTPAKLLQQLRLERACRLLEDGALALKRVAWQSGFASEYNLRRAFSQALGVTPGEYRQRFCRRPSGHV